MALTRSAPLRPAALMVLAGLATLGAAAIAGAPRGLVAAYAAALGIGLALHLVLRLSAATVPRWVAILVPLLLALPLLLGPEVENARRWLRIGPVSVQPALILLPLLLRAGPSGWRSAAILLSGAALLVQPDAGTLLALVTALLFIWGGPGTRKQVYAVGAIAIVAVSLFARGEATTVRFVEHVIEDLPRLPIAAITLYLLSLFLGTLALLRRPDAAPAAVFWAGALLASLLGPYPTPLIGLSASAMPGLFLSLPGRVSPSRGEATAG
ncbi:hypothetical protein [Sphingomicrobium astaxanthinifaciens]|uniref:hypothetical protein n=1 Tax=Sphingomicrobium astaxanthinifaciens TaxID=1227949 RepID=UPI00389AD9EF